MPNMFDDPVTPALGGPTPLPAVIPPAGAAAVIAVATPAAVPAATEPKKLNIAGIAKVFVALVLVATVFGTLGMAYPGNFLLDWVFRAAGNFIFLGLFQGNIVNAGYGIVLLAVASFALGHITKK